MSKIPPLTELLTCVANCKISGLLQVVNPQKNPYFDYDMNEPEYINDGEDIVNVVINDVHPREFLEHAKKLKILSISFIHQEIDLNNEPLLKVRIYNEVVFDISSAIEITENKQPKIIITNKEDIRYIGKFKYVQIEREKYKSTINHTLKQTLLPLRDELMRELNILQIGSLLTFERTSDVNLLKDKSKKSSTKAMDVGLVNFEEMFYSSTDIEPCLNVLRQIQPPFLSITNDYIGKNKGIFPAWVSELKNKSIIKALRDIEYKDLLNSKIIGLELSKDATEFRKTYSKIEKIKPELQLILSQLSLKGKSGK